MITRYIACDVCGVFFHSAGPAAKYCSQACRKQHNAEKWHPKKTCVFCGVKFDSENSKRRYCSEGCKEDARRGREQAAPKERCECGRGAVDKRGGKWLCRDCLCADEVDYREYWFGLAANLASISGRDTLTFRYAGVNS